MSSVQFQSYSRQDEKQKGAQFTKLKIVLPSPILLCPLGSHNGAPLQPFTPHACKSHAFARMGCASSKRNQGKYKYVVVAITRGEIENSDYS